MSASTHVPVGFGSISRLYRKRGRLAAPIDTLGQAAGFLWQVVTGLPIALRHYRSQTIRSITDLTWGRGSLVVGGGTAPVLVIMGIAVGAAVAVEGYSALNMIGLGPLTGMVSALGVTRELGPIIAAIGFAAQGGCRMTAEIGSMRISEEIDAIEALGLRSVSFVVTTRVIAGLVAIVPTFLIALTFAYVSCSTLITVVHRQSAGVYGHYFSQFVNAGDIAAAVAKVAVFGLAVIVIHCYYGFFASGGPEGVGLASGKAIRLSFVTIIVLDMIMTLALWGVTSPVEFKG